MDYTSRAATENEKQMCVCVCVRAQREVFWDEVVSEINRRSSWAFSCTINHVNTEAGPALQITILHQGAVDEAITVD